MGHLCDSKTASYQTLFVLLLFSRPPVVLFRTKIPIMSSVRNSSKRQQQQPLQRKQGKELFAVSFKPENFIPGIVIGFILGFFFDLSKPIRSSGTRNNNAKRNGSLVGKELQLVSSNNNDEELKMVLVVRQDLKMGTGKIASQCAHAATGLYSELTHSHRYLLSRWEHCGQAKIVVGCRNQHEMNKLREAADNIGLPTYVVADAGRTQVAAGSNTVLAIGPGKKSMVDSVTGKQHLL